MVGETGGGACTPEELEMLLEDAFVTRDREMLAGLFEGRAVVATGGEGPVRGGDAVTRLVAAWEGGGTYIADPLRVVQARDIALILGTWAINVARRGRDGAWRYAIAVPFAGDESEDTDAKEEQ